MSESSESAPIGEEPSGDDSSARIRQHAVASGSGSIIQSGRDTHYYLGDGVRRRRQTDGPVVEECPYPGLAAFTADQAPWFFGRDRLIAEVISRLDGRRCGGGPLVVVAPSGAGKSSLFQAGLIPTLMRGALPGAGSREWPRLVFTPTSRPIAQAAAGIASVAGAEPESVTAEIDADPGRGAAILRAALPGNSHGGSDAPRAVIVVDQLEELFTLCTDESERRGFIDLLARLTEAPAGGVPAGLVICGLRADFYAPCTQYPQLRSALQNGQILLGPMSETELRETILYPAQSVDLDVEPGLVELLLRDIGTAEEGAEDRPGVGYEAGRLPLLAHALRETWQQRHGSTLTVDGYRATGGIQHAVAQTAEQVFTGLDTQAQLAARRLFLRLVKVGEGPIEDTRRRATRKHILAEITEPGAARAVLDAFTRARLLTQDQDTVEITHEALLRAWPRLRQWIDTDRADNLISQQLEDDAASWDRQHRDSSVLYRGARLAAVRTWAESTPLGPGVSPSAAAFLAASSWQEYRAVRIRRAAVAILAVLALLASGAAVFGFKERSSAQASAAAAIAQRNRALSAAAAVDADALYGSKDPGPAAQLSLAAYKLAPTPDAYGSVLNATGNVLPGQVVGNGIGLNTVAFNSAGSILAVGSGGTLQLWRITPANPTYPTLLDTFRSSRPTNSVPQIWFDPGHSATLAMLYGNQVLLDTFSRPAHYVRVGTSQPSAPAILAFSHDGRMLAVGHSDGTVQLWNAADPTDPVTIGHPIIAPDAAGAGVSAVAFSSDNSTLATVSGPVVRSNFALIGTVRLWNIADPANPRLLSANLTSIAAMLAFSPVGRTLTTGTADDSVRLWDVTDASHPKAAGTLLGHTGAVVGTAFSPDGHTLVTASLDNSVRLWNVSDPTHPTSAAIVGREPTTEAFTSVAIGRDGLLAATAITILNGSVSARTWLWETDPVRAANRICAASSASPPITPVEWRQYFPDQPYDPPCPARR